jgi:hypothetical protein
VATTVGDTWIYYTLGSVVELLLQVSTARVAWAWPGRSLQ